ncbi:hypothetical protein ACUNV4_20300 [Granulosicoccus sp. 3-233]|uniref:hypothetical protein n=1 Tax=Granulosicoccus sp. 3-233 TaxID=3417969 RepID=UPI003D341156
MSMPSEPALAPDLAQILTLSMGRQEPVAMSIHGIREYQCANPVVDSRTRRVTTL